jgi:hypothetical protein
MNDQHLPSAVEAALNLRAREGLSFAEVSRRTGVPAGVLASACYGLPTTYSDTSFVELAVVGPEPPACKALTLRGPRGHLLEVPADVSPETLAQLAAALPC